MLAVLYLHTKPVSFFFPVLCLFFIIPLLFQGIWCFFLIPCGTGGRCVEAVFSTPAGFNNNMAAIQQQQAHGLVEAAVKEEEEGDRA